MARRSKFCKNCQKNAKNVHIFCHFFINFAYEYIIKNLQPSRILPKISEIFQIFTGNQHFMENSASVGTLDSRLCWELIVFIQSLDFRVLLQLGTLWKTNKVANQFFCSKKISRIFCGQKIDERSQTRLNIFVTFSASQEMERKFFAGGLGGGLGWVIAN